MIVWERNITAEKKRRKNGSLNGTTRLERERVPAPAPSVWPRLCRASLRPPLPGTPAAQRTPPPGASPSLPSHSAPDWTTQHMTQPHEPQKHSSFYTIYIYMYIDSRTQGKVICDCSGLILDPPWKGLELHAHVHVHYAKNLL